MGVFNKKNNIVTRFSFSEKKGFVKENNSVLKVTVFDNVK